MPGWNEYGSHGARHMAPKPLRFSEHLAHLVTACPRTPAHSHRLCRVQVGAGPQVRASHWEVSDQALAASCCASAPRWHRHVNSGRRIGYNVAATMSRADDRRHATISLRTGAPTAAFTADMKLDFTVL